MIASNLKQVRQRIDKAAQKCGRDPKNIRLIAVSKTQPIASIEQAYRAGQRRFGENYVQEAVDKINALAKYSKIEWHFIGRIQSNKTALIARHFDWVHTICQWKHARRLSEQRPDNKADLNLCIQLNLSGEISKAGIGLDELPDLVAAVSELPRLKLRGLMTLPPANSDQKQLHSIFDQLKQTLLDLNRPEMDQLSMGMSRDLEIAIASGATLVRVGTALFGPRSNR